MNDMDPNAALANLREAYQDWQDSNAMSPEENDAAERMALAFSDLDDWIMNGGFLPVDWR